MYPFSGIFIDKFYKQLFFKGIDIFFNRFFNNCKINIKKCKEK